MLPAQLVALAQLLRLAPVEILEVASFYAHLDVLADGEAAPPPLTIRVCDGLPCAMQRAQALLAALRAAPPGGARILAAPCMGGCDRGPVCMAGQGGRQARVEAATVPRIMAAWQDGIPMPPPSPPLPPPLGGLRAARPSPEAMLAALEAAGLRGMAARAFPSRGSGAP